jgi:hypothetical protein
VIGIFVRQVTLPPELEVQVIGLKVVAEKEIPRESERRKIMKKVKIV